MIDNSKVIIKSTNLAGTVNVPPSKSLSHRGIICAALAEGESTISNLIESQDIIATSAAMVQMGADIEDQAMIQGRKSVVINGGLGSEKIKARGEDPMAPISVECNESGSTIRFLIPFFSLLDSEVTFEGKGKLVERPLDIYYKIFEEKGIKYSNADGKLPLKVKGELPSGTYKVKGNVSSQFISGLLFILPLMDGDSSIEIIGDLESIGYVDLTLDIMEKSGIEVKNKDYKSFEIKGNQKYKPLNYKVEGDYSQVAFWLVAGLIGNGLVLEGVTKESLQGDKVIIDIAKEMGGNIEVLDDKIIVHKSKTKGTVIDVSQCPDVVPVLTVLCAFSQGESRIINAERVRIKESDRLKAISTELNKLGADIKEEAAGLIINGVETISGGDTDAWNDHRIAMAIAVASTRSTGEITLSGYKSVKKSYPGFWDDFTALGGKIDE